MLEHRDFSARIGNVFIPIAEDVVLTDTASAAVTQLDPGGAVTSPGVGTGAIPSPIPLPIFKYCFTTLKEGCYTIYFVPKFGPPIFGPRYRGTLRIENISSGGIRFSGD